jgi:ferrous iron transport protein A
MATTLAGLKPGDRATVVGYDDPTDGYARHLMSLGLIPGTAVRVMRFAPLGDPVEIEFRGTRLALRPGEANVMRLDRR